MLQNFIEKQIGLMLQNTKELKMDATMKEAREVILGELEKILGDDLVLAKKIKQENKIRKILDTLEQA